MSPPWMPLYIADYRLDTARLSASEHGAYLLLIMEYWAAGSLPCDDRQLARIACMSDREWRLAKPVVQPFFHDGWKHKRIDAELAAAKIKYDRLAAAGRKGGKTKAERKRPAGDATSDASQGLQASRLANDKRCSSYSQLTDSYAIHPSDGLESPSLDEDTLGGRVVPFAGRATA